MFMGGAVFVLLDQFEFIEGNQRFIYMIDAMATLLIACVKLEPPEVWRIHAQISSLSASSCQTVGMPHALADIPVVACSAMRLPHLTHAWLFIHAEKLHPDGVMVGHWSEMCLRSQSAMLGTARLAWYQ